MAIDFPASPTVGQQFTAAGTTWQWDGTTWNAVPQPSALVMSDIPPANPAIGQLWWRASTGQLYIWYNDGNSSQWVQAAGVQSPGMWEPIGQGKYDFNAVTELQLLNLGAYRKIRYSGSFSISAFANLAMQFSLDNGATWKNGASDYGYVYTNSRSSVHGDGSATSDRYFLTNGIDASQSCSVRGAIEDFNQNARAIGDSSACGIVTASMQWMAFGSETIFTNPCNAIRLHPTAGNMSGSFTFEGVRG
jgi:hypothetical protein